jgi:PBSX family phage terminase large subunit
VPLSDKQQSYLYHSTAFINVADGAVRSGKTHTALRRFAKYAIEGPPGDLGIFARTERTARSNVVFPMIAMNPPRTIHYVQGSGELYVFGRRCWVIGVNDMRAEEKVRGMTLAGGYMNEVALYPQIVFDQAIARSISIPGAQFFADCNPDSPFHWLNTQYLEAGHPKNYLKRWRFQLADNPILPPENVEMLKALYGPGSLFYRRNIDGEWVVAEGAIYPQIDIRPGGAHVVEELPAAFDKVIAAIDYGTATVTTFLLIGRYLGTWYVIKEYYHDAEATGTQKTDAEFSADFRAFIAGWAPAAIEVDPSAASFKKQLRSEGVRRVNDAENEVIDGIRLVSTALTATKLKIHQSCQNTIRELAGYVWDRRAQERGEDQPVKKYDHTADALRYGCQRIFGPQPQRALRVVR